MESKIFLYNQLIGERIRYFRRKRGLTQASLAKLMELSPQQLQKYEIGKNRISASRLKLISEILDVPINSLTLDSGMNLPNRSAILSGKMDDSGVGRLVYLYSLIKSDKIRKLIIQSSAIYVENGL